MYLKKIKKKHKRTKRKEQAILKKKRILFKQIWFLCVRFYYLNKAN